MFGVVQPMLNRGERTDSAGKQDTPFGSHECGLERKQFVLHPHENFTARRGNDAMVIITLPREWAMGFTRNWHLGKVSKEQDLADSSRVDGTSNEHEVQIAVSFGHKGSFV